MEEALEDVVVTVVDNNKVEVEVEAKDLDEGATSATFAFVEEYEDDLEGVWTVNGVEYDFDEVAAVAEVKAAKNLVELWAALNNEDYFTGAVEENITDYEQAVDAIKADPEKDLVTAEDVNKMIADVNKAVVDDEAEAAIVKAVNEAANEFDLLKALQIDAFTNVYAELIEDYQTDIGNPNGEAATIEAIQRIIDQNNVDADKEALTLGDVSAVTEDLELPATGKYGTTITWKVPEDQNDNLEGKQVYITAEGKVTRPSSVVNDVTVALEATIAIGEEDEAITATETIDVTIKAIEAAQSTYAFEYDVPTNIVAEEDIDVDVTFKTIENLGIGYYEFDVRFAFVVDGPEDAKVTFSATDSSENLIVQEIDADGEDKGYWGPETGFRIEDAEDYDETTEFTLNFSEAGDYTITFSLVKSEDDTVVGKITDSVTVSVAPSYVDAVLNAETTNEMIAAINRFEITEYRNLSSAIKFDVADIALFALNEKLDEDPEYTSNKARLEQDLRNIITAVEEGLDAINGEEITIVGVSDLLDQDYFVDFVELSTAQKDLVAEYVLNNRPDLEDGGYKTVAAVKEAIAAGIAGL